MKEHKFCKVHKSIRLNPDFTSSGIECGDCGIVFGNPINTFPLLPAGLIYLIEIWNDYWDYCSSNENLDRDGVLAVEYNICMAGLELEKIINQYYPCHSNIKNWKLFQTELWRRKK
jgi:hypothetical protein